MARYAQEVAVTLQAALRDRSVAAVAAEAGLARSTIYQVLAGEAWPDMVTLAALEGVLGVRLWPEAPPD